MLLYNKINVAFYQNQKINEQKTEQIVQFRHLLDR